MVKQKPIQIECNNCEEECVYDTYKVIMTELNSGVTCIEYACNICGMITKAIFPEPAWIKPKRKKKKFIRRKNG